MLTVLYVFGCLFAILAGGLAVPFFMAVAFQEFEAAQAFFATSLLLGFVGGGLILALKGGRTIVNRRESLLLAGLVWLVIPVPAALPFFFSGYPTNFLQAYFEAVSGFTTTGASILDDLSEIPLSLIFFRSFLQWLGGLAMLLLFGLILGELTGPERIDRRLRQINRGVLGSADHIWDAARSVVPLYGGLTFVCFLLLMVAQIPAFDALCLSLSTLSTGGFMPRAGTVSLYGSPFAELVLAVFMFLGAVSIFWVRSIVQFQWAGLTKTKEPIYIGVAIIVTGVVLAIPLLLISPEQGFRSVYHSLTLGIATAASIVSTTGFAISAQTQEIFPFVALMFLCMIGGGSFSTAGGLKFFRLMAMLEQAGRDLKQLVYPHGVGVMDKKAPTTEDNVALTLAANFAVFLLAIAGLALLLSVTDLSFSAAIAASVSAISNIGPAFGLAALPELADEISYSEISASGQLLLCAGMIFGRVEVLVLLSLFYIGFWRA